MSKYLLNKQKYIPIHIPNRTKSPSDYPPIQLASFSPEVGLAFAGVALASLGGASSAEEPARIRKDFPESWIWETIDEERLTWIYSLFVED